MCIYVDKLPCALPGFRIVEGKYIMEATAEPRTSQPPGHTATHQSRAIRCDRRFPCSNCQTANLSCRTLIRRPVLAQVRPSTRNNEHIRFNRLEEQLSDIQQTLSMLQSSLMELKVSDHLSNSAEMREKPDTTGKKHTATVIKDGSSLPSPEMIAYEGASSLSVQSHLASEMFRDLVKGNPLNSSAPDISMEYSQLDKALNRNDPQSLLYDKSFPETETQQKSEGNTVMPP
ncbi:putative c-24 sterol reductase protein [Botrytis fragariae]|uniref:Putative c-24 sterol reductase protein n=1 Tax=Botrytis fragariae TaxID=1964551 RepID=A0A8H6AR85_9HELO|nr:putative c-24 sterol reductase protein [Botrytis fragariae]KAF5872142.1 putative c-24 sterol reductase protein [Botrytis fragariae]